MIRWVCWAALVVMIALALPAQAQGVTAEAIGQANLRATTDVNSALLGQIQSGTRYPVIGRSEFYPWLLLGDPATNQPIGWVFQDLVTVSGELTSVPFSTLEVGMALTPSPAVPAASTSTSAAGAQSLIASATPAGGVVGLVTGDINIRYGPGVDYPRIGFARAGEQFQVIAWHTQFPWLQIRYPGAPNGVGWVARDLLEVQGDVFSLPSISQTSFALPTLTPTPPVVRVSSLSDAAPAPDPTFQALGDDLWSLMLQAGFEPETSRLGALFLLDLQTGQAVTFGNQIAFSGMSLNKIAILAALYRALDNPPRAGEAMTIANTMVCSENTSSNEMLAIIGQGDPFRGAQQVTAFMQQLGLRNSFLMAPFVIDPNNVPQPTIPIAPPVTAADKTITQPDPWNQMTVDDLGWLLGSIYQCAYNGSGPLLEAFAGAFEPRECRQMLHAMSSNRIGALIEAGVPAGTRVAHKHGWIADTHGDAGVVFTPGGDFVLVTALHNPTWLDFSESFPLIAEITRRVYNYYNPDAPLAETRSEPVPEKCDLLGSPLIEDLMSASFEG